MGLQEDLEAYVKKTHADQWSTQEGHNVPEAEDLGLGNEAIRLDGTVLYADLADSTGLVKGYKDWFAAEVYKNFLYCAARVIRARGGTITAYDGDRVMAVFIGDTKNTAAAKCGLQINHVTKEIVQPAIKAKYPDNSFTVRHKVGIDSSKLFIARTGIRGSNDLVWVGRSANNAAKMAALSTRYPTYISADVYNLLNESSKFGGSPKQNMWTDLGSRDLGYRIYGSTWWWGL
jgi:class 3 adenylate cyclase